MAVNAPRGDYNIKHVYLYMYARVHITEGEKRAFILLRDACRSGRSSCDTHAAATNDILLYL